MGVIIMKDSPTMDRRINNIRSCIAKTKNTIQEVKQDKFNHTLTVRRKNNLNLIGLNEKLTNYEYTLEDLIYARNNVRSDDKYGAHTRA